MSKDQYLYVQHIYECVNTVFDYILNMDEQMFLRDKKTQDAVIRNLEVMGEASKRVNMEFRNSNPHSSMEFNCRHERCFNS